ncbi:hypothetical protein NPIL_655101, partial [Nephila pilipes]
FPKLVDCSEFCVEVFTACSCEDKVEWTVESNCIPDEFADLADEDELISAISPECKDLVVAVELVVAELLPE